MNVELLLKVKKHIQQKPTRLRMTNWIIKESHARVIKIKGRKYFDRLDNSWGEPERQTIASCGTAGCIAGWTCILSGEEQPFGGTSYRSMILLGLEHRQAKKLFYVTFWKPQFYNRYMVAKNQRERAKIVGEVIDDFIKEYGNVAE